MRLKMKVNTTTFLHLPFCSATSSASPKLSSAYFYHLHCPQSDFLLLYIQKFIIIQVPIDGCLAYRRNCVNFTGVSASLLTIFVFSFSVSYAMNQIEHRIGSARGSFAQHRKLLLNENINWKPLKYFSQEIKAKVR